MKQQIYITDQEKENCQRVVAAFHDFFQQTDILVLDTGNYGFALLKYFSCAAQRMVRLPDHRPDARKAGDEHRHGRLLRRTAGRRKNSIAKQKTAICKRRTEKGRLYHCSSNALMDWAGKVTPPAHVRLVICSKNWQMSPPCKPSHTDIHQATVQRALRTSASRCPHTPEMESGLSL